ncbi:filamentous hemagglutinin N-terminal domain-containing protein, partial [Thermodesulfobacteriota bacterium]
MRKRLFGNSLAKGLMIIMAYSLVFPVHIFALPQGAQVVSGQADISQPDANNMNINQGTNQAIINWQQFSIAHPEAVRFFQPGAASIALNRVIGGNPSLIYGLLSANGRIFVINPSGILVGPTGRIETNAFLASTLDISNEDFLSGNYEFKQSLGQSLASIINQGTIASAPGGFVSLLAPAVENQGTIVANLGKVYIGAGEQVTLNFVDNALIGFAVDKSVVDQVMDMDGNPMDSSILNEGLINADGGEVILSARTALDLVQSVVNNEGIIQAQSLVNENGVIKLIGGDEGIVANSGVLDAS